MSGWRELPEWLRQSDRRIAVMFPQEAIFCREAADEIVRLRAIFRVNMLRHTSASHEEIDRILFEPNALDPHEAGTHNEKSGQP